jgi:hypothetical protein
MDVIYLIFFIVMILILWLRSDAIVEWGEVFGLSKILKLKEFREFRMEQSMYATCSTVPSPPTAAPIFYYPTYLKLKHNCFPIRLMSCPVCITVWLSIIGCLIIAAPLAIPLVYVSSLIIYAIFVKFWRYQ